MKIPEMESCFVIEFKGQEKKAAIGFFAGTEDAKNYLYDMPLMSKATDLIRIDISERLPFNFSPGEFDVVVYADLCLDPVKADKKIAKAFAVHV